MRKRKFPCLRRHRAGRSFVVPVSAFGQRQCPRLCVVFLHRVGARILLDERHRPIVARCHPAAAIKPCRCIRLVTGHGDRRARLQRKRHHSRRATALEFQLLGKRRDLHPPNRISTLWTDACITRIRDLGIPRARHHFLRVAVPPGVGHHSMRSRKRARRNRCVAHACLGRGIRIRRLAEPRALLHQPFQAPGPLPLKFVDVIPTHLVHHQHNHQLRPRRSRCRCISSGYLLPHPSFRRRLSTRGRLSRRSTGFGGKQRSGNSRHCHNPSKISSKCAPTHVHSLAANRQSLTCSPRWLAFLHLSSSFPSFISSTIITRPCASSKKPN